MWLAHIPFHALLPRVAAIVHHGGIGTTAEAFRAGIAQLVVPFAYDQFDNALRVKRLGVGDMLLARQLSVSRMYRQLSCLLDSEKVRQDCKTVAGKMAQSQGLSHLLDQTESLLFGSPSNQPSHART